MANPFPLMIVYHVFLLFVLRSSFVAAGFPQSRRIRTGALGSRSRCQPIPGVRLQARARCRNVAIGVPLSDDKLLGLDAELRRKSRVNTWSKIHAMVFPVEAPFPLVRGVMKMIVLQLRTFGYRSAHNYLASARRNHLELDHAWKPSLDIEYREAALVARRGLGPSKKARPFSLDKLAIAYCMALAVATPIVLPYHAAIIGLLFMFRCIELANLRCQDIFIDAASRTVAVHLPSCKTDIEAKGVKFRWRCLRGSKSRDAPQRRMAAVWFRCPFCVIYDAARISHGYADTAVPSQVPGGTQKFVKIRDDGVLSTVAMATWLKRLHATLADGIDANDSDLSATFGGHSLRRSGAQHWFWVGLPESIIRRLARWKSAAIELYLLNAPLLNLGSWSLNKDAVASLNIEHLLMEVRKIMSARTHLAIEPPATAPLTTDVVVSRSTAHPPRAHRILIFRGPSDCWRSACSYKFGVAGKCEIMTIDEAKTAKIRFCIRGCFACSTPWMKS